VTIDRLEVRLLRLPLVRFFETSFGRSYDRTFVLVRLRGGGVDGWGEAVADADPYYSSETTETVWHILTEFLAPLVVGRTFAEPADVWPALARVRGHNMAKAAVEMAAWDLHAKQLGVPLWRLLGGSGAPVASGVSIGIQDSIEQLEDRVAAERADGYQRIKIKIKPGWDLAPVEWLRARFGAMPLMADANAAYTLADTDRVGALDQFDLMMIEQPLGYDDLLDHATLQRALRTPLCLDESIVSPRVAEMALREQACRIINIKPGRMGGFLESRRVHDLCEQAAVPVWHGGMLESGIGRAHNLHLSTLPNFRLPGDIAASRRYYAEDLIEPPIEVSPDGTVPVPSDGPGIGVAVDHDRVARATLRHTEISSS